ncbi:MAG TPA: hypothetical protein VMP89_00380 [Solirubrobacteraceae bacterium]|nr:hypothetical protein [Solirubrobacteraceae bacterium]
MTGSTTSWQTSAVKRRSSALDRRRALAGAARRRWRWAALPFGVVYLVLLALNYHAIIATAYLDADTVSAPVIGQLLGSAAPHAHVVLGVFGWYSTLLFLLATRSLPLHREIWELAPYAMALAGAGLAAWSVWQVAGRVAASLTAVLLICAAPATLHLLLSMTQHAPDWFCVALLAAWAVLLTRRAAALPSALLFGGALLVGVVVGVNAAGDVLLVFAGIAPFALALGAELAVGRGPRAARAASVGLFTLAVAGASWAITGAAMSALHAAPEAGLNTTALASGGQIGTNFRLWWQSIAVLGNGDFFGHNLSFTTGLSVACAVLSLTAIVVLARAGWGTVRDPRMAPGRLAFMTFWCSSAAFLTGAFLLSAIPVDIHADRYLVGLIYAAAAVVPVVAMRRAVTEALAIAGTSVVALAGVVSLAQGADTRNTGGFPSQVVSDRIAAIAAREGASVGYSGYWDAAPITWAAHFRVKVYPVSICDRGEHLCRFDLHYITSWYTPRAATRSFLLGDPSLSLVPGPTPDLGRPSAVFHVGQVTMYVYPYDVATRILANP